MNFKIIEEFEFDGFTGDLTSRKAIEHKNETHDTVLKTSVGYNNRNIILNLSSRSGWDPNASYMSPSRFSENEYTSELRQQQTSRWVADGIDHFKSGRPIAAFQCLNKALNINPKNVEGFVSRGALYVYSGNLQRAIEDFETALELNPHHANARKYMGETLVALGRSYEEENKFKEAKKAYQHCLAIISFHEEAQNSLEFLKSKSQTPAPKNLIEGGKLILSNLTSNNIPNNEVNDALKQLLNKTDEEENKDKKIKNKSKKRKGHRGSSSTSSSSSSESNDSSSSSSSSSPDSSSNSEDSEFKKRKKHRSRSRREKQNSLSPLSKRMAMKNPDHDTPKNYQFNKPANAPYPLEFPLGRHKADGKTYEAKLKTFLEQTKGESDNDEDVRKFLQESLKSKKDKKENQKKKKEKKSKQDSKKKMKDMKLKHKLDEYELYDALKKELGIKYKRRSKKHGLILDEDEYILQKVGLNKRLLERLSDSTNDKNMSVRKAMTMKEPTPKKVLEPLEMPKKKFPPPMPKSNPIPQWQVVLDKCRLVTPPKNLPLSPGSKKYDGRGKPPEPPGRPRSESRSPRRSRSRSRGKYSRSHFSSGTRSRYGSYSRSYYSRSRSRSGSYYSRSRSRSRSCSGDSRRLRGGFRHRVNDRGIYYKPRFQNPRQNYPRGGDGSRGGYYRDSYNDRYYRGSGNRFYNRGGRRPRGRLQRGGNRDFRDSRYDSSRSRDSSRSYSGSMDR